MRQTVELSVYGMANLLVAVYGRNVVCRRIEVAMKVEGGSADIYFET